MTRNKDLKGQMLNALAGHNDGATSRQIAADLGCTLRLASKYLGNLFFQGAVERDLIPNNGPVSYCYLYRIKPLEIASPPAQWQPEVRVAEPAIRREDA